MLLTWCQSWSPASLFAAGEQGGWWDPSDFSTMFQDSAGTTPVTAVGQPVGLIRDKSGRGNHLLQATTTSRPLLQQDGSGFFYLLFDGVDDGLATAGNVDFSATSKVTAFCGLTKSSDAAASVVYETSVGSGATDGTFALIASNGAAGNYLARARGTVTANDKTYTTYTAPISNVISSSLDTAGGSADLQNLTRINAAAVTGASSATSAGNFTAQPLNVGRRSGGTLPFNGRIYQLIARGAASTAAQIAQAERFVGSRMGIAL